MSHFMNAFLATEITCIPQVLDRYVGKYYSNTISNGATWIFFLWHILHFIFEEGINLLLKKMRIKEYVRVRLKQSVWNLAFYGTSFFYCTATLYVNHIDIFSHRKLLTVDNDAVPAYLILGFVILCTFYAHSVIWEFLRKGFTMSLVSYLWLMLFISITYFTRRVELSLSLLAVVSFSQFGIELGRCVSTLLRNDSEVSQFLSKVILCATACIFALTHLVIVPLFFLFPLGYTFIWESQSFTTVALNNSLWLWLLTETINNPLYKFLMHWIYHTVNTPKTKCPGSAVECSLFQPRDDVAYNLKIIRQEIKEREAKMLSLRKPKNRNMLLQTLKCMVALKKKLRETRSSESSDSEESEGSESENRDKIDKNGNSESEDDASDIEDERASLVKASDPPDRQEHSVELPDETSNENPNNDVNDESEMNINE